MLSLNETSAHRAMTVWNFNFEPADWTSDLGSLFGNLNKEYLAFLRRRATENLELSAQLLSCKTPLEVAQVYQAFFTKAFRDCQSEYVALARIGSESVGLRSNDSHVVPKQEQADFD